MKDISELPLRGYLNIMITFEGYKDYIQNDTRKQLCISLPKKVHAMFPGVDFEPEIFSLLKRVAGKISRAYGASYVFNYKCNSNDEIEQLIKFIIHGWYGKKEWKHWKELEMYFLENIGGY